MNRLNRVLWCVAVLLTITPINSATARKSDSRYSSQRIEILADKTGIAGMTDTVPDGMYIGMYKWNNYPLCARKSDGETVHVGIQLFTPLQREMAPKTPVYDFLERYLLEFHLGSAIDKNMAEGVTIEHGQLKTLHKVLGDTTVAFSWTLDDNRRYTAEWSRNENPVFRISFPASYRLLGGYIYDEATRRLPKRIAMADTLTRNPSDVCVESLEKCDSLAGEYFIAKGGCCVIEMINNDRYYFGNDSTYKLVYNPLYPVESLSNLLTTGEIPNSFTAHIRMRGYNPQISEFTVPLNSLINHFIKEGCTPYFGLKGVYPSRDRITALLEMVNHKCGYEHMMSITFDTNTLPKRNGVINIKLTPFLPLNDIKNLFAR